MPEDAFHQRLKRHRGSATAHSCIECGGSAVEWAYQHGGDPMDEQGYSPMCRSCHRKLDYRKGTPMPFVPGAALTPEIRRRGQSTMVRNRKRVGTVFELKTGRRRWRAALEHRSKKVVEHYATREEAEAALDRMRREAGV